MSRKPKKTPAPAKTAAPRVLALVATIPQRLRSCERLLEEIAHQSRPPDAVILCLDGWGDLPTPACTLPIIEYRTATPSGGPGHRWRVAENLVSGKPLSGWVVLKRIDLALRGEPERAVSPLAPDDIILCLDDDIMLLQAPDLIRALVAAVEEGGGAAAAMGFTAAGHRAPPGLYSSGPLIYAAGCGLTCRARHLEGLQAFAEEVKAAGGPDALGAMGDDDALVSAHLWKRGITILHAATGNIFAAPNTQDSSQTQARELRGLPWDAQKRAIEENTGWPWPVAGVA